VVRVLNTFTPPGIPAKVPFFQEAFPRKPFLQALELILQGLQYSLTCDTSDYNAPKLLNFKEIFNSIIWVAGMNRALVQISHTNYEKLL